MRLYIAEKPSLGRAIAQALGGPQTKQEGCIQLANGDVVTWCIGHLLEQAEPDAYDPRYKQWRLDDLPIVPQSWQLRTRRGVAKQLNVIKRWLAKADEVVHAGDPDREGQLLVDEVLHYLGNRKPVLRALISDLNLPAVKRALARLQDNRQFAALSASALARARADWLYGINMTRAYTLRGRQHGYAGVLSVGRVQTPLLGLVVRRDEEIERFVSKPYYELYGQFQASQGVFTAKWQPGEALAAKQDEEGRLLERAPAQQAAARVQQQCGHITQLEQQEKREPAPLPYSLSALQIDCARRYQLSAQQVLDSCQALYEKHKLITYPRSDCRYLPEEHWSQATQLFEAMRRTDPDTAAWLAGADRKVRSRAWNDAKVSAHHAIIPTGKSGRWDTLSRAEQQVYRLICRNYIAQFHPHFRYIATRVELQVADERFHARGRQVLQQGWRTLFSTSAAPQETPEDNAQLPVLQEGERVCCQTTDVKERHTQPPAPFTDATLLRAMTGIARFVQDAEIRKKLRETDGIGTEATRAGIIETLFKRQFLVKQGKQIRATATGRALIHALPPLATTPDMTALWEAELERIAEQRAQPEPFLGQLGEQLHTLISTARQATLTLSNAPASAPAAGAQQRPRRTRKTPRKRVPKRPPPDAQPPATEPAAPACPQCAQPMRKRQGPYGAFWGCSAYPRCRHTLQL